jgi:dCTP deaminase
MSQLVDRHIKREQERSMQQFLQAMTAYHAAKVEDRGSKPEPAPVIEPYRHTQLQPASYDVRLGREVRTEHGVVYNLADEAFKDCPIEMGPGHFMLGHTEEYFRIPAHLCARVEGKSSTGRRGLAVHVTAGFIDPGFQGQITLELVNHSQVHTFNLVPGMLIAQVTFHRLTDQPERIYGDPALGSHYQFQTGATPAALTEPESS